LPDAVAVGSPAVCVVAAKAAVPANARIINTQGIQTVLPAHLTSVSSSRFRRRGRRIVHRVRKLLDARGGPSQDEGREAGLTLATSLVGAPESRGLERVAYAELILRRRSRITKKIQ
jgi:hypothetical protein